MKVVTALITISAVRLLQVFMDIDRYDAKHVLWMVVIHLVFLASAVLLAFLDRVTVHESPAPSPAPAIKPGEQELH